MLRTLLLALVTWSTIIINSIAGTSKAPVTGSWEWSEVPPFSGGGELTFLPSGNVLLRDVEAAGPFRLAGAGIDIEARITSSINGNLDDTFSGRLFGQAAVAAEVDGVETVIFEGPYAVESIGLLTSGSVMFHGRGAYQGTTLHIHFSELPALNAYEFSGWFLSTGK